MNKVTTPVSGGGKGKGAPDGVSASPADARGEVHGRSAGGESGGGAYANPHTGKEPDNSGFMGHGGQTDIGYHGGGQAGEGGDAPNAATGSDTSDGTEHGSAAWSAPAYEPHRVSAGGRTFDVVETSGTAEAEATGKVATTAPYEGEQTAPGSG